MAQDDLCCTSEVKTRDLTTKELLGLYWSLLWRNIVISLAGVVIAFAIGFFIGIFSVYFGRTNIGLQIFMQIFAAVIGIMVGAVFFFLWILWIFNTRFGKLRLAIIRSKNEIEDEASRIQSTV